MAQNLKLGDNITSIKWNGWTIRGKNTNEVIVEMIAKLNLSRRQIAPLFNVSYQTICNRVNQYMEDYPELWAEAESKQKFYDTFKKLYYDNDTKLAPVAKKLGISVNKARMLERDLIPKDERKRRLSLDAKQNSICHAIFGYEYSTDKNFANSLKEWFSQVPKEPKERLTSYYLDNKQTTLEERFQRMHDIDLVRQYLIENVTVEELLHQEVICQNRRL